MIDQASPSAQRRFTASIEGLIEDVVLWSRYLLVPLYLALLYLILTISIDFFRILAKAADAHQLTEHILRALELLDITMVANLIWFISAGSYYVYIHPYPDTSQKKRPRSLAHISTGILKEKMAGSLIVVSSVNLLQIFMNISVSQGKIETRSIAILVVIHLLFIAGLLAFNHSNAAAHHNHSDEKKKNLTPKTRR